ncbi:uncharacterized protein N7482_009250 [Penicillium canariense]|uniref:Non-structural maintenance of chromosomes element 1 homolog n=1 Tax=Penicillium canariense TaxID=189055 RepID=A0A9W9HPW5_9EURO|nr:uncharacterized protein N7482_009250 [Penicillium canariense]KAJ5152772.1 hypothetical protein N7482_009250 [Penicillium canariense]
MDVDEYNDLNRAFLQAFMARSAMTFEEAQPVLAALFSAHESRSVDSEDITQEHLSSLVSAANTAISPFDLEIRTSRRQDPEETHQDTPVTPPVLVYALVNTTSDALTQLATTYSADEIAFVKRVLDFMFDTNNKRRCEGMVISSMQAIQMAKAGGERRRSTNVGTQQPEGGAAQNLTLSQAENMMKSLTEEGWLEKSRRGYFSLTPRALMELRGWLVSTYNDDELDGRRANRIKFCAACKDIITSGQRCDDLDCKGRIHDHCVRNFFRMQKAEKCPICKADWSGDKFVGERAAVEANRPRQSRNARQAIESHSDLPNSHAGASDEDGSAEEEG